MIKVFIVDDYMFVCDGLWYIFQNVIGFEVVGEVCDGLLMIVLVCVMFVQVFVFDLLMFGCNGVELIKQIKDEKFVLCVLVFIMYVEQ